MHIQEKQFITNKDGEKLGVILPIDEYEKLIEELEELDDIRLYDEVKKDENETPNLLSDYIKKRGLQDG